MRSERSREARLRRLARDEGKSFHKARRPFVEWGVRAKYYVSDMTNTLVAVYATLEAAEEDFHGKKRSGPIQFDWRRNWKKRVEPLLGSPLVQGALNLGMSMLDPDWRAWRPTTSPRSSRSGRGTYRRGQVVLVPAARSLPLDRLLLVHHRAAQLPEISAGRSSRATCIPLRSATIRSATRRWSWTSCCSTR